MAAADSATTTTLPCCPGEAAAGLSLAGGAWAHVGTGTGRMASGLGVGMEVGAAGLGAGVEVGAAGLGLVAGLVAAAG